MRIPYKQIFQEDISKKNISKAIQNVTSILSKRVGVPITVPEYTMDFSNSNGDFTGIRCIVGNDKAIRFNWKINGNSANVESISFWMKPSSNPTLELEVGEENLIKVIDIIQNVLQGGGEGEYLIEDASPASKGKVSIDIANSINGWKTYEYEDNHEWSDALQNKKPIDLYNQYTFWYNNLSDEEVDVYRFVPKATFMKYLKNIMDNAGIENIFSRKVKVTKASKEILKVNKKDAQNFKDTIYKLDIDEKIEMIKMGVVAVIKGYSTARLYLGKAGIGKSKAVKDQLDNFSSNYEWVQGSIRSAEALFKILSKNNKEDKIIVFDDVLDSILKNKEVIGVLKSAMDNKKERIVSYKDKSITFVGKIILISNLHKSKIDNAIISRTSPIEIDATIEEMSSYIRKNLEDAPPPVPIDWKLEVWNFINDELNIKNITNLDFRVFSDACLWRASSPDNPIWKKFVAQIVI